MNGAALCNLSKLDGSGALVGVFVFQGGEVSTGQTSLEYPKDALILQPQG
jgi:hypothetical protein